MKIRPFKLERYFAQYEFTTPHILCASDCEPLPQAELLALANDQTRGLWDKLTLGYTETAGHPLLREAIAALYTSVSADDILVMAPEEAIFIALQAILTPGDHVIAIWPGYASLHEIPHALGCRVSFWKPHADRFPTFAISDLFKLARPDTRLIIVNFPHNPTGAMITPDDYKTLIKFAAERGITIFSDEMYRWLEIDPAPLLPSACELHPTGITLGGLSKSFGLAGLRIGWLVAHDAKLRQKIAVLHDYTTICNSAPAEILALIALRAQERLIARCRSIIACNLELLHAFFTRHAAHFDWYSPAGGSVALPALRHEADAAGFCRDLATKQGVLLLPGSVFGCARNRFRIGFGRRSLPAALAQLESYMQTIDTQ